AGVAPIQARCRALRTPTNSESFDFGLLAEDGGARTELAAAVLGRGRPVALELLSGEDLRACRDAAAAKGLHSLERVLERSPYLRIDGDFDAYFRGRGKNLVG